MHHAKPHVDVFRGNELFAVVAGLLESPCSNKCGSMSDGGKRVKVFECDPFEWLVPEPLVLWLSFVPSDATPFGHEGYLRSH